jgi:hypothetical protein
LNLHPGDILDNKTNNSNNDSAKIGVLVDSVAQNESVHFSGTHIKHTENHITLIENNTNEGKRHPGNVLRSVAQNESVHFTTTTNKTNTNNNIINDYKNDNNNFETVENNNKNQSVGVILDCVAQNENVHFSGDQ